MLNIPKPYLLFLGDAEDDLAAKTARGILDWRTDDCAGQLKLAGCRTDLGLNDMGAEKAFGAGVRTLVVGVANRGGVVSEAWIDVLDSALRAGLNLAAGLHNKLGDIESLAQTAQEEGRKIFDVRHPYGKLSIGDGATRPGKRLLPVGTDCSCGKMYTALAIEKELHARGVAADFRATGQTGVLIAGGGMSVDAVPADFISGVVEELAPANDEDHWDVIEGQGSLYHPSFAGVSLGLLHGAQADALVLCHEPTRSHIRGLADYPIPDLKECMDLNLRQAKLTNRNSKFVGLSINTSNLNEGAAKEYLDELEQAFSLPACDPYRFGIGKIVDGIL